MLTITTVDNPNLSTFLFAIDQVYLSNIQSNWNKAKTKA